jgi:hypothetical protein
MPSKIMSGRYRADDFESWQDEQDKLTLEARLLNASPEVVYQSLKRNALRAMNNSSWEFSQSSFERNLFLRNESLVNLGLATFGFDQDTYNSLYNLSRSRIDNEADGRYKLGLRTGCLANIITSNMTSYTNTKGVIDVEELRRILSDGGHNEYHALLRNPAVPDDLLVDIFNRTGPATDLPDKRWRWVVEVAGKNPRLNSENLDIDYDDPCPDLGYRRIQEAIFHLLEIAPVQESWVSSLCWLLNDLDPFGLHSPSNIDKVLKRWKVISVQKAGGISRNEGTYTDLSQSDELRCLIAILYGGYLAKKDLSKSNDVALRSAYYAQARLTASDMKVGFTRDEDIFIFAALSNARIIEDSKLRKLFEEEYLFPGSMTRKGRFRCKKYAQNLKAAEKRSPGARYRISVSLREAAGVEYSDGLDSTLENTEAASAGMVKKLERMAFAAEYFMLILSALIMACAYVEFGHKGALTVLALQIGAVSCHWFSRRYRGVGIGSRA